MWHMHFSKETPLMNTNEQTGLGAQLHPVLRVLLAFSMVMGVFVAVAPLTAVAQSPCGDSVTVVYGDSLREIANRCNTTVAAILAANPEITNRNLIRVGQVITLPGENDGGENEPTPDAAALTIQPTSGPPGTTLRVTGQNYPPLTEVVVGIGVPASEPITSFRAMTNAGGNLNTQIAVPADAGANERFVVVAYVPGQGGARATSQEFITTSGQEQNGNVTIAPTQGPPNSVVRLQAVGFAPNTTVEIGFGEVESEYDVIAQAVTDGNGAIDREVTIPSFAQPGDQYVFVVTSQGSTADSLSNVFTVTGNGQTLDPQVTISPRSGSPSTNVQVAVSGFPPNTRITYGMGVPQGQLLNTFSARTNSNGSAQLTIQVPDVDPGTNLEVLAFVPQQNSVSATSDVFNVTERDNGGSNLFTRTNIYLIALEDGGQSGMEIGCGDSVIPVEVSIEPTIAPLTAALETLFGIDDRYYGQSGLYNALAQSNLTIDRIDIINGVASIYLSGQLQVGGVCDEPRVRAQIEETALQYYTVNEVQIFVNGQPLAF
jgi:hypothetical protein